MQNQSHKQVKPCHTRYCLVDHIYHFRDYDVRIPAVEAHVLVDTGEVVIFEEEEARIASLLAKAMREHEGTD